MVSPSIITIKPKTVIRIERDYSKGELCQFKNDFPKEINERVSPMRFKETIDKLNELLKEADNPKYSWFENCLACITLYSSILCIRSHYDKMVEEICFFLNDENLNCYNELGVNFRDPRKTS
ncbi:11109_t:CDS:2 [Entrophospora sp. SA101]|nr:11109_t:CDS:2 [Entrophospora sp. SA101]